MCGDSVTAHRLHPEWPCDRKHWKHPEVGAGGDGRGGEERLGGASGAAGRTFHDVSKIPGRKDDWDPKTELAPHPSRRGTRSGTLDMPDKGRPQASGVHPRQTGHLGERGPTTATSQSLSPKQRLRTYKNQASVFQSQGP